MHKRYFRRLILFNSFFMWLGRWSESSKRLCITKNDGILLLLPVHLCLLIFLQVYITTVELLSALFFTRWNLDLYNCCVGTLSSCCMGHFLAFLLLRMRLIGCAIACIFQIVWRRNLLRVIAEHKQKVIRYDLDRNLDLKRSLLLRRKTDIKHMDTIKTVVIETEAATVSDTSNLCLLPPMSVSSCTAPQKQSPDN